MTLAVCWLVVQLTIVWCWLYSARKYEFYILFVVSKMRCFWSIQRKRFEINTSFRKLSKMLNKRLVLCLFLVLILASLCAQKVVSIGADGETVLTVRLHVSS